MATAVLTHEEAEDLLLVRELWARLDACQGPVELRGRDVPVLVALSSWLTWISELPIAPAALRRHVQFIKTFTRMFGDASANRVSIRHLEQWLQVWKHCGPRTRHVAMNAVLLALAWRSYDDE